MRLVVVSLFLIVCLLALAFAGLLNWISSLLFLILEILAEVLRRLFLRRMVAGHHPAAHPRVALRSISSRIVGRRHFARRKLRQPASRVLGGSSEVDEASRRSVLVPLTQDDPQLIGFALRECRVRRAELVLLFLRPLMVTPMGPNPFRGLEEDEEAKAILDRTARAACSGRVAFRPLYAVSHDQVATILDVAGDRQSDFLIFRSSRRSRIWGALMGDLARAVQAGLPRRASLILHAA